MNRKNSIIASACVLLLLIGVWLSQPMFLKAVLAKYKSTDHFAVLAEDARVRYENDAKHNALALGKVIDGSQRRVEAVLKARFKKPIEVYVCASQDVFNEYVFLSKDVKGAVYWGKLFLSPGAFSQDPEHLAEITAHELTHYLFYTHLGERAHLENVPLWFREGVAVFVANGGAEYTRLQGVAHMMTSEEKTGYLSGDTSFWFSSNDPRDAVAKNGTANWLLYRVGALFVHYLHDSHPAKFDELISLLLSGVQFDVAMKKSYGKDTQLLLAEFSRYLTEKIN